MVDKKIIKEDMGDMGMLEKPPYDWIPNAEIKEISDTNDKKMQEIMSGQPAEDGVYVEVDIDHHTLQVLLEEIIMLRRGDVSYG